ncbi:hypothetical protein N1030_07145 [Desulfovibrio mangrovi]|uniref:hypothetical protein n=1 Tax=Desulfovibrio mangrovi TaxID=2976983 RepID=UPI0022474DD4|nr:hypothetical protein [Desulfovibrio mangrovi]UZP68739.1 hypothetical protein N1030_07145 [Desulfovibrio mangrovi]
MNILLIVIGLALAAYLWRYALGAAIIGVTIWVTYLYWKIALPVLGAFFVLCIWAHLHEKSKIKKWKKKASDPLSTYEIDRIVSRFVEDSGIVDANNRNGYIFKGEEGNLPYGRLNAFLNFFNKSANEIEVYYFSAIPSSDFNEVREYGTVITRDGLYVSVQGSKKSDGGWNSYDVHVPFAGVVDYSLDKSKIKVNFIAHDSDEKKVVELKNGMTTLSLESVGKIIACVKDSSVPKVLYDGNVVYEDDNCDEIDEQFQSEQVVASVKTASEISGVLGAAVKFQDNYAEIKGHMDGSRGHGYSAEYGNTAMDRLVGRQVVNAGQQLDSTGRQVKGGADRIVDGVATQAKYYKTANESIGAAFVHKQAVYLNPDGTMMPIEVARDQYQQALACMQKRIDSGQVPNAPAGTPAAKYVKKGWFTYNQACNIGKAGTLESLAVDMATGVVSSSMAGGISGAIVFATCVWQGKDVKEAAKTSIGVTLSTMGKGVLVYTLTMQLSRKQFANVFVKNFTKDGIRAGFKGINNPIAKLSDGMARSISESSLAKTSVGEFFGLRAVTGRAVIAGGVVGVIVFGPDIVRALRGKISKKQLMKNSAVGATSLVGTAIGQALIPIPVLGAMTGAFVSGVIAKKTLDAFVEDDAVQMFQVLKEEYLDVVMQSGLSQEEFDSVTSATIAHAKLHKVLQDMYQCGESRDFARDLVNTAVCSVLQGRQCVTCEMVDEGYADFGSEMVAQVA